MARTVVAALTTLGVPSIATSAPPPRAPVLTMPHFAFFSDLTTNLNDALIVAGRAREGGQPELFHLEPERSCIEALAPSARTGWNLAVDFYAEIVSPGNWSDRPQTLLRLDLAGLEPGRDDPRATGFLTIGRGFLAAATPAYEACRWPAQDAENRRWIDELAPRLKAHEAAIGTRLAELYQVPWHGLPLAVDVVGVAPPLGANTRILTPGGHILVSSSDSEGDPALEIAFHEASHTLVAPWREDPVPAALAAAAESAGISIPRDLWHVVLFFTTGQVVKESLAAAGNEDYHPYVEDLWTGRWAPLREPVHRVWPAYLRGERSLSEASRDLVQALTTRKEEP